jgi:hypothetical protein
MLISKKMNKNLPLPSTLRLIDLPDKLVETYCATAGHNIVTAVIKTYIIVGIITDARYFIVIARNTKINSKLL